LWKGLKGLQEVKLNNMEVYTGGAEEQNWFAEHWPLATVGTPDYTTDADAEKNWIESEYLPESDDDDSDEESELEEFDEGEEVEAEDVDMHE
ncbi:hypothetical protein BGW39_007740, partial [Mortierella sp. 14UC]